MRKMISSNSEKSGRRSSILKPAKLRNPLETVTTSSAESSPTTKLKRRVSFAEKKHVKEFCDSMEQGTVWDSTYEESEGSHMRSLFSPTDDANCPSSMLQLPVNNSENDPNLDSDNSSKIFELPTNHPKYIQKRISILEMNFLGPKAIEENPQLLADKENIPINPMSIENVNESLPIPEESRTTHLQRFEIYCDDENSLEKLEKERNYLEDTTLTLTNSMCLDVEENGQMEMTKAITSVLDRRTINKSILSNEGMEMTEAIDSLFPGADIPEKTRIFQQNGMEMTEAISSVLNIHRQMNGTILNNEEMIMTEAIVSHLPTSKSPERTEIFQQNVMEMTEAIPSVLNNHKRINGILLNNEEMVMTEAIMSHLPTNKNMEKTQNFQQNAMEMTEAIPSILNKHKRMNGTILNNEEMVMTEAIESHFPTNKSTEKTQIFQQNVMEMTEAIPSILNIHRHIDRTILNTQGMEMTETISSILNTQKSNEIIENTQIFNQKGMEMTEAIQSALTSQGTKIISEDNRTEMLSAITPLIPLTDSNERTEFFHQGGMEMTEAIPSLLPVNEAPGSDQITHNNVMEFAEQSVSLKRPYQTIFSQNSFDPILSSPQAKSPKDHDSLSQKVPSQEDRIALHRLLHGEVPQPTCLSSNLQNQSMEFTTAITSHMNSQENPITSRIPRDDSMEMTEVIQSFSSFSQSHRMIDTIEAPGISHSDAILSSNNPNESEMDSADSSKENRIPENDMHRRPVSRPLFDREEDIVAESTVKPLENSAEFMDQLRLKACSWGRDFRDLTTELTRPIGKSDVENASFSSSDIQNIEAPSYLFADENGEDHSYFVADGEMQRLGEESLVENNKQEEVVKKIGEHVKVGGDEMTIDIGAVELPDVEFTEEIESLEERRRTRVICKNNEEEIMKKRKIHLVPEECDQNSVFDGQTIENLQADERRRTHVIHKLMEEENCVSPKILKSKTSVINTETLQRKSAEIYGERHLETRDNIRAVRESDARSSEEECKKEGENFAKIDNDEVNSFLDISEEEIRLKRIDSQSVAENLDTSHNSEIRKVHKSLNKNMIINSAIVLENDLILKSIQKSNLKHESLINKKTSNADKIPVPLTSDTRKLLEESLEVIKDDSALSAFEMMRKNVEKAGKLRTCLWEILRISEEKIFVSFRKTGLVFGVIFHVPENENELEKIEKIFVIPRLSAKETSALRLTDRLIVEHIDKERLKIEFKTYDHVLPLIKCVTEEVKVIYDFYEEIQRMSLANVMEMLDNKLCFLVRTKTANIILKISINIKSLTKIGPEDVDVVCLLGNVRKNDIKNLIKNVKRNHKFLTLYRNDVCDYIELMEESSSK